MPSGLLGKAALAAALDTDLYTVPAGTVTTANVNLCNTGSLPVRVRLAIRSGALGAGDYMEYDAILSRGGVIERTGIAMSAGETITVHADAEGVAVRAHGFEEAA